VKGAKPGATGRTPKSRSTFTSSISELRKKVKALRFLQRKRRSHRKANTRGLRVVFRPRRTPAGGHVPASLPSLPPGAMPQRTVELPKLPARTAFPPEVQESARRVTGSAHPRPAYEIDTSKPLFRNEPAMALYEDRYQARLREIQRFAQPWSDGTGVVHGSGQSPKTITWSTADYREFAGDGQQVSR